MEEEAIGLYRTLCQKIKCAKLVVPKFLAYVSRINALN